MPSGRLRVQYIMFLRKDLVKTKVTIFKDISNIKSNNMSVEYIYFTQLGPVIFHVVGYTCFSIKLFVS